MAVLGKNGFPRIIFELRKIKKYAYHHCVDRIETSKQCMLTEKGQSQNFTLGQGHEVKIKFKPWGRLIFCVGDRRDCAQYLDSGRICRPKDGPLVATKTLASVQMPTCDLK